MIKEPKNFMVEECLYIQNEITTKFCLEYLGPLRNDMYWKLNRNFLAMDDVESFVMRLI